MRKFRILVDGDWLTVDEVLGYLWFEGMYIVCVNVLGVGRFLLPLDRVRFV
jgi:hypothetical protein